ncbi:hypothetical protein ABT381_33230, partial [Streptomyces sp. NPDC000151]|uniref:hypothetical protein n=1 Tax=Streptomyces sp. NPDC000151 TaxID=3154244 RepID=UPI00332E9AEF
RSGRRCYSCVWSLPGSLPRVSWSKKCAASSALRISDIEGDPILTGALRTALVQARDAVFDTA